MINLDEVFERADFQNAQPCLSEEDVAETEKINRQMRKVQQDAARRFARSAELARGLRLRE